MADKKSDIIVAVVAGHGKQVQGKWSPKIEKGMDIPSFLTEGGRFREWKYARVVADDIVTILKSYGYDARLIVPEDDDVTLGERVRRVNALCTKYGAGKVLMLEIHANAVGYGDKWESANGWECYTTVGKTKSDTLAEYLYKRAEKNFPKDIKIRKDITDGDCDKEMNFYVIRKVNCPAILSENFFYTNKKDLEYMSSDAGIHAVVRTHVEGTIDYINSMKK